MKKILVVIFLMAGVALVLPGKAQAAENPGTLRHAYQPHRITETGAMRARVNNMSSMSTSNLVCVEAYRTNGTHRHLGCLKVNLAATNSDINWAAEFDAPTYLLTAGTWRIVYNYQGSDGMWNKVMSINMKVQEGMYSK